LRIKNEFIWPVFAKNKVGFMVLSLIFGGEKHYCAKVHQNKLNFYFLWLNDRKKRLGLKFFSK
jgi:hypothetical protein